MCVQHPWGPASMPSARSRSASALRCGAVRDEQYAIDHVLVFDMQG